MGEENVNEKDESKVLKNKANVSKSKLGAVSPPNSEAQKGAALEIPVEGGIERAMKVLKRKLIKEGVFKELKLRRYYEKPTAKRKRKNKESIKKVRKDESRMKKSSLLM